MAMEYRNGKPYYYHKIRKGSNVVSKYVGSGEFAELAAALDKDAQESQKEKQELKRQKQYLHHQADEELKSLEKTLNEFFTSVVMANGYHKHNRQWRKKRKK